MAVFINDQDQNGNYVLNVGEYSNAFTLNGILKDVQIVTYYYTYAKLFIDFDEAILDGHRISSIACRTDIELGKKIQK